MPDIEKPRVFVFEPERSDAIEILYRLRVATRLVLSTSVEESLRIIERHFQIEENPFSRAVIALGRHDRIKRSYEGEEVIDDLLARGMSGKRIALYTNLHRLSERARDNRVKFVLKRGDELEKFLGL
jgi:rRNA-processing protein FCF1